MTYQPKPIDFCDHVGHGICGNCPDDPETVDDVRFVCVDIGITEGVAEKLDAMTPGEQAAVVDAATLPSLARVMIAEAESELDGDCDCGHLDPDGHLSECRESFWYKHSRPLYEALAGLLDAFPRLSKEFSTAEQQIALQRALRAVGR